MTTEGRTRVTTDRLHLTCAVCDWQPASGQTVADVQDHMVEAHGTEKVVLNLSVRCECGKLMDSEKRTDRVGAELRDHFRCFACGKRGYVVRGLPGDD